MKTKNPEFKFEIADFENFNDDKVFENDYENDNVNGWLTYNILQKHWYGYTIVKTVEGLYSNKSDIIKYCNDIVDKLNEKITFDKEK